MSTATLSVVSEETEADKAIESAKQLAARIVDLVPWSEIDSGLVLEWDDDQRAAVVALMDDPPTTMGDIPDCACVALKQDIAYDLLLAAIRRKLDNAMRRDERVRNAEKRLGREKSSLRAIDDELEDLKKQRKGQEAKVDAAVFALQSAITDQGRGQNTLPLKADDAEADEPKPIEDPAATAAVADLDLSSSLTEKLVGADLARVSDVIAWIGAEPRKAIKGVGEKAIDTITDALVAWRSEHPMPEA